MTTSWRLATDSCEIYEKYIVPAVSKPWYELMLESGKPCQNGPIADLACGTGAFLEFLSERINPPPIMTGVDANPDILKYARGKNLISTTFVNANVSKLPFNTDYFSLIYCQQGIQYFAHKEKCFQEIIRCLKPGGIFLGLVWSKIEDCSGYHILSKAVLKYLGEKSQDNMLAPFKSHNSRDLSGLAKEAGFKGYQVTLAKNYCTFNSAQEFVSRRILGSPLVEIYPYMIRNR